MVVMIRPNQCYHHRSRPPDLSDSTRNGNKQKSKNQKSRANNKPRLGSLYIVSLERNHRYPIESIFSKTINERIFRLLVGMFFFKKKVFLSTIYTYNNQSIIIKFK
jgi:hypothetical protein